MISWSSSVGEPWVAGSIPASTSARVALEPQALPVTRRAHGDVAPLPRAGSIHPGIAPAIVSLAQQVERGGLTAALGAGSSPARDAARSSDAGEKARAHRGPPEECAGVTAGRDRHVSTGWRSGNLAGLITRSALVRVQHPSLLHSNGEKGRVMPARRELITRVKLGAYEGPPRAACPRGGRTPAMARGGSSAPRTSGVMRAVESSDFLVSSRQDVTAVRARRFFPRRVS